MNKSNFNFNHHVPQSNFKLQELNWSQSLLNDRIEKNILRQKHAQKIIYLLLILLILCLVAIIFLIQIPKRQPFVVFLNSQGQIEKSIDLEKNLNTSQLLAIEQYQIIEGIKNLLSVSQDKNLQKIKLEKGMNYILPNSTAEKAIRGFLNQEKNNPYLLQKKYRVEIEIENIKAFKSLNDHKQTSNNQDLMIKKRYYQIQLKRNQFDLNENLVMNQSYEIITSHIFAKSKNETTIYKNPLGIFIDYLEINPINHIS